MAESLDGWVMADNLRPFLELLSRYAEYAFDDTDWDTVALGLEHTADDDPGAWYAYPLAGARARLDVDVAVAVGADAVSVRVTGLVERELRLRAATLLDAYGRSRRGGPVLPRPAAVSPAGARGGPGSGRSPASRSTGSR